MDMKAKPRVLLYRWPTEILGPLPPTNDGRGLIPYALSVMPDVIRDGGMYMGYSLTTERYYRDLYRPDIPKYEPIPVNAYTKKIEFEREEVQQHRVHLGCVSRRLSTDTTESVKYKTTVPALIAFKHDGRAIMVGGDQQVFGEGTIRPRQSASLMLYKNIHDLFVLLYHRGPVPVPEICAWTQPAISPVMKPTKALVQSRHRESVKVDSAPGPLRLIKDEKPTVWHYLDQEKTPDTTPGTVDLMNALAYQDKLTRDWLKQRVIGRNIHRDDMFKMELYPSPIHPGLVSSVNVYIRKNLPKHRRTVQLPVSGELIILGFVAQCVYECELRKFKRTLEARYKALEGVPQEVRYPQVGNRPTYDWMKQDDGTYRPNRMNQDMQAVIDIANEGVPGVSNKCNKLPFLSSMPTVDMKVRNLDRQWDVAVVDYNDDTGEPVTLEESMGSVAEILQGERAGYATVHSEDKHPLWLREFWVRPTSNLMGRHKPDQKDKTAAAQWDRKRSRLAAADERSRILKDSDRAVAREAESKGYRRLPRPWQAPSVLSYNVEGMTDGNRHLMEQELNEARDMALQNALDEGLISLAFLDFARGRRSRIDAQGSGEYMGDSLSGYNSFLQVHWTRRVLPFPSVQRNHMRTRPGAIRDGLDDWGKPAYRIVRVAYTPGDRALEYLIRLGGGQSHGASDAGGGTNGLFTGGGKPHRGRGSADRERGKSIGHASRYEEWVSLDDHGQEPIPDGFPDSDQLLDRSVDYQGVFGTHDPLADQYESEVPEEVRGVLMWGAPDLWGE